MAAYDLVIVGGGLQGGLLALALLQRPGVRLLLVERAEHLGGNHTWCFHAGDVPAEARPWLEPLVAARWPGYTVRFPGRRRELASPYTAMTSPLLDAEVRRSILGAPGCTLLTGRAARTVGARAVVLEDGTRFEAGLVVDARGPDLDAAAGAQGYQKFVGLEVELRRASGIALPVLMDADLPQEDGYRFVYLLPFTPTRLLVEDTRFADGPELDTAAVRQEVLSYLEQNGLRVVRLQREETGVLPMPWHGTVHAGTDGLLVAGCRGGWYNPATGYSLPQAVRLALRVAAAWPESPDRALAALRRRVAAQQRFTHLLNFMLFRLVPAAQRWRIFARFHELPLETLARFYALETTPLDRVRILAGQAAGLLRWRKLRPLLERRAARTRTGTR